MTAPTALLPETVSRRAVVRDRIDEPRRPDDRRHRSPGRVPRVLCQGDLIVAEWIVDARGVEQAVADFIVRVSQQAGWGTRLADETGPIRIVEEIAFSSFGVPNASRGAVGIHPDLADIADVGAGAVNTRVGRVEQL